MNKSTKKRLGAIVVLALAIILLAVGPKLIKDRLNPKDWDVDGPASQEDQSRQEQEEEPEVEPPAPEPTDEELYPESTHLTIGLKGSATAIVKQGDPYIESGAYCYDDRKGALDPSLCRVEGEVDTGVTGTYTVTYTFITEDAKATAERLVTVVAEESVEWDSDGISVMMYHYVYDPASPPENLGTNHLSIGELEEQLTWLRDNNYYYPSFAELRAYVDGRISLPEKSVLLTFDDGEDGFLRYGIPLLEQYQVPATSFIIGIYNANNIIMYYPSPYITYQSHSFDMHKAGGYIGHGGVISALTVEEIVDDLNQAAAICRSKDAFAYPYGDYTDDAREAVRQAEILCSFTTEFDRCWPGMDPTVLPRIRVSGGNALSYWIGTL